MIEISSATKSRPRRGFTLVELLVSISIIGVLIAMTLPAVQRVRDSGRRTVCASRLHNLGLAVLNYESAHFRLPAGAERKTAHAWSSRVLPYIEQSNLYDQIDFDVFWDTPVNEEAIETNPEAFSCPSSWKTYPGFTDYCGISGSWISASNGSRNGLLFPVSKLQPAVKIGTATDGMSNTLLIAEGVAVTEENYGYWACGLNCFSHDDGPVNNIDGGAKEIASLHSGGAQAVLGDGSVRFLSNTIEKEVIGALCTRNQGEVISE